MLPKKQDIIRTGHHRRDERRKGGDAGPGADLLHQRLHIAQLLRSSDHHRAVLLGVRSQLHGVRNSGRALRPRRHRLQAALRQVHRAVRKEEDASHRHFRRAGSQPPLPLRNLHACAVRREAGPRPIVRDCRSLHQRHRRKAGSEKEQGRRAWILLPQQHDLHRPRCS